MNPTDVTPRRVISSSAAKTGGILDSPEKDHWYLVLGVKEPIVLDFGGDEVLANWLPERAIRTRVGVCCRMRSHS